ASRRVGRWERSLRGPSPATLLPMVSIHLRATPREIHFTPRPAAMKGKPCGKETRPGSSTDGPSRSQASSFVTTLPCTSVRVVSGGRPSVGPRGVVRRPRHNCRYHSPLTTHHRRRDVSPQRDVRAREFKCDSCLLTRPDNRAPRHHLRLAVAHHFG